jgi:hypothetical protein
MRPLPHPYCLGEFSGTFPDISTFDTNKQRNVGAGSEVSRSPLGFRFHQSSLFQRKYGQSESLSRTSVNCQESSKPRQRSIDNPSSEHECLSPSPSASPDFDLSPGLLGAKSANSGVRGHFRISFLRPSRAGAFHPRSEEKAGGNNVFRERDSDSAWANHLLSDAMQWS